MSDDLSKVDWGVAIHPGGMRPEGLANDCLILWSNNGKPWKEVHVCNVRVWGDFDNDVSIRLPADHPYYRQDAEPVQADIGIPMTDPIAKRMEALVKRMAADWSYMPDGRSFSAEARAIVALLPEPVDADLVEARSIIADAFRDYSGDESDDSARLVEEGKMDDAGSVKRIVDLAHRLRTRALERDSREG